MFSRENSFCVYVTLSLLLAFSQAYQTLRWSWQPAEDKVTSSLSVSAVSLTRNGHICNCLTTEFLILFCQSHVYKPCEGLVCQG